LRLTSVRNYVGYGRYRPRSLAEHPKAKEFYQDHSTSAKVV
jgi:hypothetical protein